MGFLARHNTESTPAMHAIEASYQLLVESTVPTGGDGVRELVLLPDRLALGERQVAELRGFWDARGELPPCPYVLLWLPCVRGRAVGGDECRSKASATTAVGTFVAVMIWRRAAAYLVAI